MKTGNISSEAQQWLQRYAENGALSGNPAAAQNDFELNWNLTEEDRLAILSGVSAADRRKLLGSLPTWQRGQVLGGTAIRVEEIRAHNTGMAYDVDYDSLPREFSGYDPKLAWTMAAAAKRAYEARGESSAGVDECGPAAEDLVRQGWDVQFLGAADDADPKIVSNSAQGYVAFKDGKALVSIRGTEPDKINDMLTDADLCKVPVEGGMAHGGFVGSRDSIWSELKRALEAAAVKMPEGEKLGVHLTGHSLGASIATLLAKNVHDQLSDSVDVTGVYLFAAPRTFDPAAAFAYDSVLGDRTFRHTVNRDVVPRIPPAVLGFEHVGQEVYFDRKGTIHVAVSDRELVENRVQAWLGNWVGKLVANKFEPEEIANHSMHGYVKHLFINKDATGPTLGPKVLANALSKTACENRSRALQIIAMMTPRQRTAAIFSLRSPQVRRLKAQLSSAPAIQRRAVQRWLSSDPLIKARHPSLLVFN